MKKIFLLFSFLSIFSFAASAQCTPVPFGGSLTNPDSTVGVAVATQFYEQVIHLRIPTDTAVPPFSIPVNIDSVKLSAINGLPTGFSYQTNSASDAWLGGTFGCVIVQGTPSNADVGTIPFTVDIIIYALGQGFPFSRNYELVVLDASHAGFEENPEIGFAMKQNAPNPTQGNTKIEFKSRIAETFTFNVYNMQGQLVHQQSIEAINGINAININTEEYPAGIYTYTLSNSKGMASKRMIVQ